MCWPSLRLGPVAACDDMLAVAADADALQVDLLLLPASRVRAWRSATLRGSSSSLSSLDRLPASCCRISLSIWARPRAVVDVADVVAVAAAAPVAVDVPLLDSFLLAAVPCVVVVVVVPVIAVPAAVVLCFDLDVCALAGTADLLTRSRCLPRSLSRSRSRSRSRARSRCRSPARSSSSSLEELQLVRASADAADARAAASLCRLCRCFCR